MAHAPHSRTSAEDIQDLLPPSQRGACKDELLVDQAMLESFPASDVPSWTPTHVGAPCPTNKRLDTPRELRESLRTEVNALLATPIPSRVEFVTNALLDADRVVNRIPLSLDAARGGAQSSRPVENIEAAVRGAGGGGGELVIAARYDDPVDVTGIAILLTLARVIEGSVALSSTVRLVGFAKGKQGARAYARRLQTEGLKLRGMLALEGLAFPCNERADLSVVGTLRSRQLTRDVKEAFRLSGDLSTRSMHVPGFLPPVRWSDGRAFAKHGIPIARLASRRRADEVSVAALDFDSMADVVFGLASVITRLCGA